MARTRLRFTTAVLLAVVTASLVRAQGELHRPKLDAAAIDAALGSDWYGVYLLGKKIGWLNITRDRLEDGMLRDRLELRLKVLSQEKKNEMSVSQEMVFDTRPPHALVRGYSRQATGPLPQVTVVRRMGETYRAVVRSGKEEAIHDLGRLDLTLADVLAAEVWLRSRPAPNSEIRVREWSMEDLKADTQKLRLLGVKKSLVDGVEVTFFELETESLRQMVKVRSLHDAQGRMLSGKIVIFEMRREPEALAKNTEYSQDLFVLGQIKIDRPLGDPRRLRDLVLEVKGKEGELLRNGTRQKVDTDAAGRRRLYLGARYGKKMSASPKEIEEASAETPNHPFRHPKVQELARKAVGDAVEPREKVARLVRFVHEYVRPSLTASLPNIHDLMERKQGDCKCYALLFTNLARATGIPAREVAGFVYMGDDTRAFGGHAWNEVVLDGKWVAVDASMGLTDITPAHITLGSDAQATNVLRTLGKLSFELVEAQKK